MNSNPFISHANQMFQYDFNWWLYYDFNWWLRCLPSVH